MTSSWFFLSTFASCLAAQWPWWSQWRKSVRWCSVGQMVAEKSQIPFCLGLSLLNGCHAHSAVLCDCILSYRDICRRLNTGSIFVSRASLLSELQWTVWNGWDGRTEILILKFWGSCDFLWGAHRSKNGTGTRTCGAFGLWSFLPFILHIFLLISSKGKAIPLEAWIGCECSSSLRFPDFETVGMWRW